MNPPKIERNVIASQAQDAIAYKKAHEENRMDINVVKEMIEKASGRAIFSYVETKIDTDPNGKKNETRYELSCRPKKNIGDWFCAVGDWVVKMAPWVVIWYIAMKIVEIVANNINAVEKAS